MKLKLLKLFAWFLLSGAVLGSVDQFLLRVPLEVAGIRQAQTFYVDFRARLVALLGGGEQAGKSIEQVIEASRQPLPDKAAKPQRYLYVDQSGALQFADSLQQVPEKYRDQAQPLAE